MKSFQVPRCYLGLYATSCYCHLPPTFNPHNMSLCFLIMYKFQTPDIHIQTWHVKRNAACWIFEGPVVRSTTRCVEGNPAGGCSWRGASDFPCLGCQASAHWAVTEMKGFSPVSFRLWWSVRLIIMVYTRFSVFILLVNAHKRPVYYWTLIFCCFFCGVIVCKKKVLTLTLIIVSLFRVGTALLVASG